LQYADVLYVRSGLWATTDTQGCESHKYRTIFTLAVGKWLRVGLVAGLAAFDDATNSDRKV